MKKDEAVLLAEKRSKLVIEYIETILSNKIIVDGSIRFGSYKIDGETMCTLDIIVPEINFEKHLNLGITVDHCDVLYRQLFKDFLKIFLEHETIGISRYYSVKYSIQENFTGVNAVNSDGSKLKINFVCKGQKFDDIVNEYNKILKDYVDGYKENQNDEESIGSR